MTKIEKEGRIERKKEEDKERIKKIM